MKKIMLLILGILVALNIGCSAKSTEENPISDELQRKLNSVVVDKDYLQAINSADMFLGSWLMRDPEKGKKYMSEDLLSAMKDEDVIMFFTGLSNPHHQGFEVIGGEKIDEDAIRFYVWLHEYYTAENPPPMKKSMPYYIDVAKVGNDEFGQDIWKVINMPAEIK